MDAIIVITVDFLIKSLFSSLVLIGLLITVLSYILNLKDSNVYIKNFKKGSQILNFVDKIFQTIIILILIFILGFISHYLAIPSVFTFLEYCYFGLITISAIFLILYMLLNLFSIAYIMKEIVKTSLK